MSASVSINLHDDSVVPSTHVLTLDDGRSFISLQADELSIIMPGFDGHSVAYARLIAAALTEAADRLGAKLPTAVEGVVEMQAQRVEAAYEMDSPF
jgi:hypothetical protein